MKEILKNGVQGFSMALADSVPGVSGGTVAFVLGFYDKFINSLNTRHNKFKSRISVICIYSWNDSNISNDITRNFRFNITFNFWIIYANNNRKKRNIALQFILF